jgi:hypothetical protein
VVGTGVHHSVQQCRLRLRARGLDPRDFVRVVPLLRPAVDTCWRIRPAREELGWTADRPALVIMVEADLERSKRRPACAAPGRAR